METYRQQKIQHIVECDQAADRQLIEVAGAADVAAVLQGLTQPPSVYFVRARQDRQDNGRTVTITDLYMVLIAVRNVTDARGDDASDEAERWSQKIERWFKCWKPVMADGEQFESLKLIRGGTLAWKEQVLIWNDYYNLTYLRRCCS